MKIDVTADELALLIESLEHRYAYSRATRRDDSRYQELADKLKSNAAPTKKRSRLKKKGDYRWRPEPPFDDVGKPVQWLPSRLWGCCRVDGSDKRPVSPSLRTRRNAPRSPDPGSPAPKL